MSKQQRARERDRAREQAQARAASPAHPLAQPANGPLAAPAPPPLLEPQERDLEEDDEERGAAADVDDDPAVAALVADEQRLLETGDLAVREAGSLAELQEEPMDMTPDIATDINAAADPVPPVTPAPVPVAPAVRPLPPPLPPVAEPAAPVPSQDAPRRAMAEHTAARFLGPGTIATAWSGLDGERRRNPQPGDMGFFRNVDVVKYPHLFQEI